MSEYKATVEWRRQSADFDYKTYNRSHTLAFEGAHDKCFIANSVKTEVVIEPRVA